MFIISLGHCAYGVSVLQTTVSGGIGYELNEGFEFNKWINPAAKFSDKYAKKNLHPNSLVYQQAIKIELDSLQLSLID